MRGISSAFAISLLAMPLAAQAKDEPPISLAKTTKWEMNYDADSCHLLAKFGQGEDTLLLRMTRYEPGDALTLMLYGKMFDDKRVWVPVKIGFGNRPMRQSQGGAGTTASKQPFIILMNERVDGTRGINSESDLAPISEALETKTSSITISMPGQRSYRLETGSLGAPFQAMRDCTDSLVVSWGYDPKSNARLNKRPTPIGNPASWMTTRDYPPAALRAAQSGIVQFRLDVDAAGKIAGCSVLSHFKPDAFSDITCGLLAKRAHFKPAIDEAGQPIKSYYINQIRFVVPSD